ncbi:MAG: hypothetical protein P1U34_02940 [Coxiellaceae bacterium]|nr:hypothetical protein [Coxiellaceae bacterium]
MSDEFVARLKIMIADMERIASDTVELGRLERHYARLLPETATSYEVKLISDEAAQQAGGDDVIPAAIFVAQQQYGNELQDWGVSEWRAFFDYKIQNDAHEAHYDNGAEAYAQTMAWNAFQQAAVELGNPALANYRNLQDIRENAAIRSAGCDDDLSHVYYQKAALEKLANDMSAGDLLAVQEVLQAKPADRADAVSKLTVQQSSLYDLLQKSHKLRSTQAKLNELERLMALVSMHRAELGSNEQHFVTELRAGIQSLEACYKTLMGRDGPDSIQLALAVNNHVHALQGAIDDSGFDKANEQFKQAEAAYKSASRPDKAEMHTAYTAQRKAYKAVRRAVSKLQDPTSESMKKLLAEAAKPRNNTKRNWQIVSNIAQTLTGIGLLVGVAIAIKTKGQRYGWLNINDGKTTTHASLANAQRRGLVEKAPNALKPLKRSASAFNKHRAARLQKSTRSRAALVDLDDVNARLRDLEGQVAEPLTINVQVPRGSESQVSTPSSVETTGSLSSVAVSSDGGGYSPRLIGATSPRAAQAVEAKSKGQAVSYADAVRNVRPGGCGA